MWISYPQILWKSDIHRFFRIVMWISRCAAKAAVSPGDNRRGACCPSTLPLKLDEIEQRITELSTIIVDNSVRKCVEVTILYLCGYDLIEMLNPHMGQYFIDTQDLTNT